MVNIFVCTVARPLQRMLLSALAVGVCALPGCQHSPRVPANATLIGLPELCRLSIEELLRVTVVSEAMRHAPFMPLVDLPLEELLMIQVVRQSLDVRADAAASGRVEGREALRGTTGDLKGWR